MDNLIQMVADQNGLEVAGMLDDAGPIGSGVPEKAAAVGEKGGKVAIADGDDDLAARLAALRK